MNYPRYCIFCGQQVSPETGPNSFGKNQIREATDAAFGFNQGPSGLPLVMPVVTSAYEDCVEHMAFQHSIQALKVKTVNGVRTECGPWVSLENLKEWTHVTTSRQGG